MGQMGTKLLNRLIHKSAAMLKTRQIRFLIVGGLNTIAGYFLVVGVHYCLHAYVNMVIVGIIANVLAITVSFVSQKLLVFRTKGNWLQEYLRCYVVYGGVTILNILGLWFLVDVLNMSIWLAPLIMVVICCLMTYFGHVKFTFKGADE